MKKITRYSNELALKIIADGDYLERTYNEVVDSYNKGELDNSFAYGNYFNLYDLETNTIDPKKVVVQWLDSKDRPYEVICDSLAEALCIIDDIVWADGNLRN